MDLYTSTARSGARVKRTLPGALFVNPRRASLSSFLLLSERAELSTLLGRNTWRPVPYSIPRGAGFSSRRETRSAAIPTFPGCFTRGKL